MFVFFGLVMFSPAFAQVDGDKPVQDTLYIIEEEITYDTLYLYDSLPQPALMSKEELLDAFRRDRGIGKLYYQRGHMYLTGADELYKLDDNDLQNFLSATDYEDWRKAKRNRIISYPLFAAGGCSAAVAGIGLYQFCASFIQTAKYGDQLLESDVLGQWIMRSAFAGFFLFAGSAIVSTAFIVPAAILTVRGKVVPNRIAEGVNTPATTMQLRVGPAPGGVGLTLSF